MAAEGVVLIMRMRGLTARSTTMVTMMMMNEGTSQPQPGASSTPYLVNTTSFPSSGLPEPSYQKPLCLHKDDRPSLIRRKEISGTKI